ncbi:pseudouridine synthase [Microthyrium microscopicum]|uniref:tRNA pseudouridine(55) synthase n=1 Tax=Microthyrium microscopicum TaxID=703497 RepID=A0A6A6TWF9_9PEZI|nr:pseudouridine synthase [Microthyrium microscopicum]
MQDSIVQGVLAIHKPPRITSTDVIRTLQHHFNPSTTFAPLLAAAQDAEKHKPYEQQRRGRKSRQLLNKVKIGHGGTLDPLATGVLITGIGTGTKELSSFLGCTKTYETVVLFGVQTDTYDVLGKVVKTADWAEVNEESIRDALKKNFTGKIGQRPPIFSAKWVNGERMYDLARRGEEVPEALLEAKEMNVDEMELLEFWEEGAHEWVMRTGEELGGSTGRRDDRGGRGKKRKREKGREQEVDESPKKRPESAGKIMDAKDISVKKPFMSGALPAEDEIDQPAAEEAVLDKKEAEGAEMAPTESTPPVRLGPAARIRMTVSSGFYVRSLCHDLGKALGSAGTMAELIRTRQGDFEVGKNCLDFDDLQKGESVWGPKVKKFLDQWQDNMSKK